MWFIRKRDSALALALCIFGFVQTVSSASLDDNRKDRKLDPEQLPQDVINREVLRRARSAAQVLSPIAGAGTPGVAAGATLNSIWQPAPIKIENSDGKTTAVQLVLLVMSQPAPPTQCQAGAAPSPLVNNVPASVITSAPAASAVYAPAPPPAPAPSPVFAAAATSPPAYEPVYNQPEIKYNTNFGYEAVSTTTSKPRRRQRPTTTRAYLEQPTTASPLEFAPLAPGPAPSQRSSSIERKARLAPKFPPVEDSQLLLQQFRAQEPEDAHLPPVVTIQIDNEAESNVVPDQETSLSQSSSLPVAPTQGPPVTNSNAFPENIDSRCVGPCKQQLRGRISGGGGGAPDPGIIGSNPASPPQPRFDRSLKMTAVLTVPRADYSEPYTVWWDAASGASRIDYHDGSASTYRIMLRDGRMQSVKVQVDRSGETDVRRCVTIQPRRISLAERALPVLPDLSGFNFAGFVKLPEDEIDTTSRVERWLSTVTGEGTFPQEVLTYRHELLVVRKPDNYTTLPVRYAVAVDSNVLGDNSDIYYHRFNRVHVRHHDPAMFYLDTADACEQLETTDKIHDVEPLREFMMLRRDPRYITEVQEYKRIFSRNYADNIEETVRKNLLIQNSRFVSSGNRKGASFDLKMNFLSDRLKVERYQFLGAVPGSNNQSLSFPHSSEELSGLRGRLPRNFDWRQLGGVTPVRNQSTCASCWAFSVVGAVEGALFVKTGRLVPLSEQTLVDCGKPYGVNGCKGSWPEKAYDYVKDQGLPALDEYTPYVGKELTCRAAEVPSITRITGHVGVPRRNILALKVAIRRHGPTIVMIDAKPSSFAVYNGGFYEDQRCKKNSKNHAMLAVGWTVHRGQTYFILKNSWTAAWGDDGYINMRAMGNICGVLEQPSYPVLRDNDVLRIPATAASAVSPPKGTL